MFRSFPIVLPACDSQRAKPGAGCLTPVSRPLGRLKRGGRIPLKSGICSPASGLSPVVGASPWVPRTACLKGIRFPLLPAAQPHRFHYSAAFSHCRAVAEPGLKLSRNADARRKPHHKLSQKRKHTRLGEPGVCDFQLGQLIKTFATYRVSSFAVCAFIF